MPVKRPVCLICLIFLFVIYVFTGEGVPYPSWDTDGAREKMITLTGTVADRQEKNGSFQIFLKDVKTDQTYFPKRLKGIIVKLSDRESAERFSKLGARVGVKGIYMPFEKARCEGMFDAAAYYMIKGYEGRVERARITGVSKKYDIISESLRKVRDEAFDILRQNMDENDASLLAAMTLGDKTGLDTEIKELYQNAGISHVLALSGLHIASVGLAILKLLKKTGLGNNLSSLVAFSLITSYAVMTGMSTSTVRAMLMFGLFVLSSVLGRTYDLMSAAAVSAVLILAADPYSIYDTGFLLSFGAVLGITCIYPVIVEIPVRLRRNKIYQSICISISVTVATLPATADSFMQISLFSVIINLVVIPLMGVVLITGFSGIILGFIGIKPAFILKITHYILRLYEVLGNFFEIIDGNILVTGKPQRWQVITYAIIAISVVIAHNSQMFRKTLNNRNEKSIDPTGRPYPANNCRYSKKSPRKITYIIERECDLQKRRLKRIAKNFITIAMLIIAAVILMLHPRGDFEIRNIDVGQGDCALIFGKDIPVIMIDGGSSDIKQVGKYRITPVLKANRVVNVDYCFLTHMDSDHVNGVIEMLEDDLCPVKFRRIIVSYPVIEDMRSDKPNDNAVRLFAAAEKKGVEILPICRGDCLKLKEADIVCLSPGKEGAKTVGSTAGQFTDENDNSLLLHIIYGKSGGGDIFEALFTGDIGENVERGVLSDIRDVSYLKVAHHGSRNSTSEDFLRIADPEISVISAGVDNSYGHPHDETLQRLVKNDTGIYCTADFGQVTVKVTKDKIMIKCALSDKSR